MPLYAFRCAECGTEADRYVPLLADLGAETRLCETLGCSSTMAPIISMGRGLTYFEEGRPRTLWNLGHEPVTVRSHEEHKAAMKAAGVDWTTAGRGRPGQWL